MEPYIQYVPASPRPESPKRHSKMHLHGQQLGYTHIAVLGYTYGLQQL